MDAHLAARGPRNDLGAEPREFDLAPPGLVALLREFPCAIFGLDEFRREFCDVLVPRLAELKKPIIRKPSTSVSRSPPSVQARRIYCRSG